MNSGALLREIKKLLAARRQELLEQAGGGLPPDDYQRTVGRILQISEVFAALDKLKQDLDR